MSIFDLNRATLIGNVTRDAELKYTGKGTAVLTFSIATNRSMQNEDGSYKDLPTFHNIVCWSKTAERVAKNIAKGKKVYVEGRIENRSYEKDGQTRYISEVVADNVIVFDRGGSPGGQGGASYSAPAKKTAKKSKPAEDDASNEPEGMADDSLEENVDPNDIPF